MGTIGVEAFQSRIERIISIHASAEDISNAEAIGVLEMMKLNLYIEAKKEEDENGSNS